MKKFIIFIMFVFVLIPGIALADDINLEIKEVKLVEKSENAEVVNNPVIDGLSVKTDIRLNILSDYVKYNNRCKYYYATSRYHKCKLNSWKLVM